MKKALFIDRDGTIIKEPPITYQISKISEFEFLPGVISTLRSISSLGEYELIMVTNQDGLGTESHPEDVFKAYQDLMLRTLASEGVEFKAIHINGSKPEDNDPDRKPGTGMLQSYLDRTYDLSSSFVIGDRLTDMELAKNLGTAGIFISGGPTEPSDAQDTLTELLGNRGSYVDSWGEILELVVPRRRSVVNRKTKETSIMVELDLDGHGQASIHTGLKFFDHMLDQIARHGNVDLTVDVMGDLEVDEHHTIEDTALALGEAFRMAMGDKIGMERYGFFLPMDDCACRLGLDLGGRPWLVWDAEFKREYIGDMPSEMFMHFFKSFCDEARCNLNIQAFGSNEHHKIESIFKALGRSIRMATRRDLTSSELPSTKGVL